MNNIQKSIGNICEKFSRNIINTRKFKTACNKVFDQDEITINPSYHSWTIEKGVVEPLVQDDAILEKE